PAAAANSPVLNGVSDDGPPNLLVELSNIATVETVPNASRIDRLDRERMISVRGSVSAGFAQADRIQALRDAAAKLNMPAGYTYTISGKGRELETTFYQFLLAFVFSVILMYIILASQY